MAFLCQYVCLYYVLLLLCAVVPVFAAVFVCVRETKYDSTHRVHAEWQTTSHVCRRMS